MDAPPPAVTKSKKTSAWRRLCRSFSVQVGTPNPLAPFLGNPWLQEMRRIVSSLKRGCAARLVRKFGGRAFPNRPALLKQSMIARIDKPWADQGTLLQPEKGVSKKKRIDKCRVVAMLAVCRSFCFYMGGAAPPPQLPRFPKAVVEGCLRSFCLQMGEAAPPRPPPPFLRPSMIDDSYEDCDPDPRQPVTVDTFQHPRSSEGSKTTTGNDTLFLV